jgi:predicted TIM-barrel fold metal-dependent hydrolase
VPIPDSITDTHLHLWNPSHFRYPWLKGVPAINRDFLLPDRRAAVAGCGILRSVFVECAAAADSVAPEADWIFRLASKPASGIIGVVASVWPERKNFARLLDVIAGHPLLKGIRRVLHTEPDGLPASPQFSANVRRLGSLGLTFDLCVLERQLPQAVDLVDKCPGVTFVLNHCGMPDIAARAPDFWRSQILRLAERPNVVCKVSGLLLYAAEDQRSADGLRPWFGHVVASFGWDRVLWGGDWPVCTLAASLLRWVAVTRELLGLLHATTAQRNALFNLNAERIYNL